MSAADDLLIWNQHWRLCDGVLSCRSCQAWQRETWRDQAFDHEADCMDARADQYPWQMLDDICKNMQIG